MKVRWLKGYERIVFSQPFSVLAQCIKGGGKSALLEHLAELILYKGHGKVWDAFSSRDGENLGWCRSRWVADEGKKVLLVRGPNSDVECSFNTKSAEAIRLSDFQNDIVITSPPLFSSLDVEFYWIAQLMEKLFYGRKHWSRPLAVVIREASSFLYSRISLGKAHDQHEAKSQAIYTIRESRHAGLSMLMDSLRVKSIDVDARSVCDFLIYKALGLGGLPREYWWVYGYVDPNKLQSAPPQTFVVLSKNGAVGVGTFPLPKWHKRQGEDLLRELDIKVEHGTEPERGVERGKFATVGDLEHTEIIALYASELSMGRIAEKMQRSSATVSLQVKKHDRNIARVGFCIKCRRAKGENETVKVGR